MASCPTCNHDAQIGARFCSICGTVLPRRVCQVCGTGNEVEALRCIECGGVLRLATPTPSTMQADEADAPHEMGPMARLAELAARPVHAPIPSPPLVNATPSPPVRAEAPIQAPATALTPIEAATPSASPPAAGDDAQAVDLYLDFARITSAPQGVPPPERPAEATAATSMPPAALAPADTPFGPIEPGAPVLAAAPHPLARMAPYTIGAVALGVGIVVAGGPWLFPQSSQAPQAASPATRPAADRPPAPLAPPLKDDPRRAAPSPVSAQPSTPATAALPPERAGASAAAARREGAVDAAADAALAAAERALAPQGRASPSTQRPAARQGMPAASSGAATGVSR